MGDTELMIAKQAIRSKQPLPDRIANAPQLQDGLFFYLQAFFDLDSERSQGFGPGRIPWFSIVRYGNYQGLTHAEIETLVLHVRALDDVKLQWLSEHNG